MTRIGISRFYSGRVQGVGFRATTRRIAIRFAVTGYVRNLPDGRVELLAEGERGVVAQFLGEVERTFESGITEIESVERPAAGCWTVFDIEY